MSTIFVGDEGTLIKLNVGADISDATIVNILYKNGVSNGAWVAVVGADYQSVEYELQTSDVTVVGKWQLQAYVETPSGIWHGDIVTVNVKTPVYP